MHQKALVIEMLKSNENAAMRTLESHEQYKLDQAIIATLRLPKQLRRLSTMVNQGDDDYLLFFDNVNYTVREFFSSGSTSFNLASILLRASDQGTGMVLPTLRSSILL